MTEDWVKIFLPEGLLDHFEVTKVDSNDFFSIHLDEINLPPEKDCLSKGFYDAIRIQDFPIRGKGVYLILRKRKWVNSSGKIVKNKWDLGAKGTRMTHELASFLKGAHR